jgi:SNF2 family DNA or RNA helicase
MLVHTPSKSLLLRVKPKTLETIKGIFPRHHRMVQYQGESIVAVPHSLEVVRVLRNMGIKAPSPIRHYYDFPRPARFERVFDHQYTTADFLTIHPRCFVLNEMGTSKTASALWAADYLMKVGYVKKVLIATTLTTMESVWMNEIFDVCMHRGAVVLHADAEKRRELLARDTDFYIINHSGLKVLRADIIARKDIDLVIVDECAAYRNAGTDAYEVLQSIAKGRKLWMMSGAPCPNAPTDAWALARLVNPTLVPAHFSQWRRKTMSQVSTYKWVPRPGSHAMAYDALQPGIRFKKADCLTLPPVTISNRHCELTKAQVDAYQQMKAHLVLHMGTENVSAVNAADAVSKLRQILCGAVKTGDHTYQVIDHSKRFAALTEAIEQAAAKVIVVVPFKGIARVLTTELQEWHDKKGDGKRVAIVNGDVSMTDRKRIFEDFRDDDALNEIVCHPAVMAHGLTLTQADMLVYYAPIYSNDQAIQVNDRINRPGQKLHMTIVRISANPLERAIYALLDDRTQTQENMLALFRKEMQV